VLITAGAWRLRSSFVKSLPVGGGLKAWIKSPGPLATLHDSTYEIIYKLPQGKKGAVKLRGDFERNPLLVFCSANEPDILCLYDCDVRFRLIKISTAEAYQPFSQKSALNWIVQDAPCLVRQGNAGDWNRVLNYFTDQKASGFSAVWMPTFDAGFLRIYASQKELESGIRGQVSTMYGSGPGPIVFDPGGD